MIDQTGSARLADFGLLTVISDSALNFTPSSCAQGGTARWMSPELIAPDDFGLKTSRPTKVSDCYSLGMVIYETVSGNPPFHKDRDIAVFMKVVKGERPRYMHGFPKNLWEILEQCWMPQPSDRPSVEKVLECLEVHSNLSAPPLLTIDEGMEDSVTLRNNQPLEPDPNKNLDSPQPLMGYPANSWPETDSGFPTPPHMLDFYGSRPHITGKSTSTQDRFDSRDPQPVGPQHDGLRYGGDTMSPSPSLPSLFDTPSHKTIDRLNLFSASFPDGASSEVGNDTGLAFSYPVAFPTPNHQGFTHHSSYAGDLIFGTRSHPPDRSEIANGVNESGFSYMYAENPQRGACLALRGVTSGSKLHAAQKVRVFEGKPPTLPLPDVESMIFLASISPTPSYRRSQPCSQLQPL